MAHPLITITDKVHELIQADGTVTGLVLSTNIKKFVHIAQYNAGALPAIYVRPKIEASESEDYNHKHIIMYPVYIDIICRLASVNPYTDILPILDAVRDVIVLNNGLPGMGSDKAIKNNYTVDEIVDEDQQLLIANITVDYQYHKTK
jgi:hypothetical protein